MKLNLQGNLPIICPRDPQLPMEAATKNYVDTNLSNHASNLSLHLTSGQNAWLDAITVSAAEVNALAGVTGDLQAQVDGKVAKAGDSMTGALTLFGAPSDNLHAATKLYVDQGVATAVAKSGDTMTGFLTLSANPSSNMHAAPKQYVDSAVSDHAADQSLHLTSAQNTWLDTVTVSSTEVNQLAGVGSNIQDQIDSKFDKVGGTISGDVTLTAGHAVFVSKSPAAANELVNKAYVDNLVEGKKMEDPISDPNLIAINVNEPDVNWAVGATVIVGALPTGDFSGLAGHAVVRTTGGWVSLKGAPVAVGDRFGVAFTSTLTPEGDLVAIGRKIVTVTSAVAGSVAVVAEAVAPKSTTLVFDEQSPKFGVSYTYSDELEWKPTNTSVNVTAGDALAFSGNMLNVVPGTAISVAGDKVNVKVAASGGVDVVSDELAVKLDGSSLSVSSSGVRVHADVMADIADRVSKANGGTVNGAVIFSATSALSIGYPITADAHATSKLYVDSADQALQGQIDSLSGTVATLNTDPTTKTYVDQQDALKVAKAGDTMTGFLTLSADPSSNLHAATKQYVDSNLSSHAANSDLHMTSAQNTWLDAITVTAAEVNSLAGIVDNVQGQLDAKLDEAGGTMTGPLILSANPTAALEAAPKQYVDAADALKVNKAGDTMTGPLILSANPTAALEAAPKQYVDGLIATAGSNLTDGLNLKVNKAGDTMTGFLTLSADPTAALHAATRQFVENGDLAVKAYADAADEGLQGQIDTLAGTVATLNTDPTTKTYVDDGLALKVNKAGDSMTGYLTLHADPTQSMHPATKQYVDQKAQGLNRKAAVRLATTGPLVGTYDNGTQGVNATFTAASNGALTVDGKAALLGDRILLKDQVSKLENGDYTVQQVGDGSTPFILKRNNTVDESSEVPGAYFFVSDGDTLKATSWSFVVAAPATFTIGTDDINVYQFGGAGAYIGGAGMTLDGNTFNVGTANTGRIVVNANNIDLATTGVVAGAYTKVTVDAYGRVTEASNPTTLGGYGITDAQPLSSNLSALADVTTAGVVVRTALGGMATRTISHTGAGITVSNGNGGTGADIVIASNATADATADTLVLRDANGNFAAATVTAALNGNATTATTLQNTRTFEISGDAVATAVNFNGSANVNLALALNTTGVTAGDYTKVTVDAKGRVTAGANPTTLAGYGITDGATITQLNTKVAELEARIAELYLLLVSKV